jgi:hypothetical protein
MLRLILAVVESLYFYLRLYSNLRRKRLLFRKKHLLFEDDKPVGSGTFSGKSADHPDPSSLRGEPLIFLFHVFVTFIL